LRLLSVRIVSDALAAEPAPEGPIRFGAYRVVERIAEGGMGLILRGEDERGGRQVAIKTVGSTRAADAAAICREIAALSRLRHPGIVRLVAHGVSNDVPWMAMELLEGRTLAEEMAWYWPDGEPGSRSRGQSSALPSGARRGRSGTPPGYRLRSDELPTTPFRGAAERPRGAERPAHLIAGGGHLLDGVAFVARLCVALDYLHTHGFVHRDVKPSNVFLGRDGRTTLLDFGLACRAAAANGNELCVGTMEYAAPEQISASPVDRRADIYSLGCLLYELVAGRPPFMGDSSAEIAERQLKRDPVAPSQFIAGVPSQLEGLIMAMLSKSPARRPDSAGDISESLANIARRMRERVGVSGEQRSTRWRAAGGEPVEAGRRGVGKAGGRAGGTSGRGPRRLPARPVWGVSRVAAGSAPTLDQGPVSRSAQPRSETFSQLLPALSVCAIANPNPSGSAIAATGSCPIP
jgi:serine/threonine protein kinase